MIGFRPTVNPVSKLQRIALIFAALFFMAAGIMHFVKTSIYVKMIPPWIPQPLAMVYISGVCQFLGGLGLLVPVVRRAAGWGLVALLVAVFPANVYMATNPAAAGFGGTTPLILWGRLPLQIVMIWWVLWCSRPPYRQSRL